MKKEKMVAIWLVLFVIIFLIFALFWSFLVFPSPWGDEITKGILPVDYSCTNGQALIMLFLHDKGETISLGSCDKPNSITGYNTFVCGDITIFKTAGGNLNNGELSSSYLANNKIANFTEDCGIGMNCTYRIDLRTISGPNPNAVTVNC